MRLVSHRGSCAHASFKPLLSCSFSIGGNGNLYLVDNAVDFRKRFPNGLAGFASNQVSELVILAAHNIREPPQRFNAIAERLRGPCWTGGASTGHRCINVAAGSGPKSRARDWKRLGVVKSVSGR